MPAAHVELQITVAVGGVITVRAQLVLAFTVVDLFYVNFHLPLFIEFFTTIRTRNLFAFNLNSTTTASPFKMFFQLFENFSTKLTGCTKSFCVPPLSVGLEIIWVSCFIFTLIAL